MPAKHPGNPKFEFRRFQRWRPGRPATAMEGRLRGKQRCFHCWRRGAAVSAGAAGHFQQLLQLLSRDTALRAEVGSILLPDPATEARPHVRKRGLVLVPAPRPLGEAHTAMPLVIEPDHDPGIQHQGQAAPSVRRRAASDGLDPVDRAVACRSQTGGAWPEQEEDDPIVPPAEDFQGLAGHQGVVVHPLRRKESGRVCDTACRRGPAGSARWGRRGRRGLGQDHAEGVEGPGGVAAEAMEATPVSWADAAGGEEALGDEASAAGHAQPATSSTKVRKGGGVKTAWKSCSRRRKGGVDRRVGFLASGSLGR